MDNIITLSNALSNDGLNRSNPRYASGRATAISWSAGELLEYCHNLDSLFKLGGSPPEEIMLDKGCIELKQVNIETKIILFQHL